MRYVGVSGFVSRAEADFALSVLPAGLTLMVGVLASPKSLSDIKNAWHKRYAAPADISGVFSPDPRCLNLLHWSDDKPADAARVRQLRTVAGPYCHGFQLNLESWPLTADAASEMHDTDIVLQLGRNAQSRQGFGVAAQGGRGHAMTTANAPDIRIGDVWKSAKGGRLVTVVPKAMLRGYGDVRDSRDVAFQGKTGAVMVALAANFLRGRALYERGGVRVGDVREEGKASTIKVIALRGDIAVCDDSVGECKYEVSCVTRLTLISRDGVNVKAEPAKSQAEAT